MDGGVPSLVYTEPIRITATTTIRAAKVQADGTTAALERNATFTAQ